MATEIPPPPQGDGRGQRTARAGRLAPPVGPGAGAARAAQPRSDGLAHGFGRREPDLRGRLSRRPVRRLADGPELIGDPSA